MTRLIAACCGLLLSGCTLSHSEAEHALTSALQSTVEDAPTVRHGVLRVQTADREIDACWAIGDAMPGRPITADTPFLSASIGKLVVAATVFDLAADGLLSLDDPLSRWLDPTLLAGLPVQGGDPAVLQITVGQLLQHRSGLPDYFDGTTVPPHDGAPDVLGLLASEPERTWTPLALLDYTRTHFPPAGAPGERFAYSDLNYDLVGMVIASATGAPWHEAVRSRVLDPLGMLHTWVHLHESPPPGIPELAGAWLGDLEIGRSPGLSLDGAGGGLATTTGDLVTLIRGLDAADEGDICFTTEPCSSTGFSGSQ